MTATITLRKAMQEFYAKNGFALDGGASGDTWSPIGCRALKVHLPNFEWRRKAIPFHDLHHVITGYGFSPAGEFEMAAWEFAAGRYPNINTTLFCLPLISMGAIATPRRTWRAFIRGRRSKTLYSVSNFDSLLDRTIEEMRVEVLPEAEVKATLRDYCRFAALTSASALLTLSPIAILAALYFWRT